MYSGGSSLLGLNYAFAGDKRPEQQEIMVLKVQDREIKMPKIDIARVLQLDPKESFKHNISAVNESLSVNGSEIKKQINDTLDFGDDSILEPPPKQVLT
jgi:hypothetical protein